MIDISTVHPRIRSIYTALFPGGMRLLRNELSRCASALDFGCGPDSPLVYSGWKGSFAVGVDVFLKYLEKASRRQFYQACVVADLRFPPFKDARIVDACVALSVLEHLPKEGGLLLLERMENWAKHRVIVVVPNGPCLQEACDENEYQVHRSSWSPEDFRSRGYRVYGLRGLRYLRGERGYPRFRPTSFWFVISQLTQLGTYFLPHLAFEVAAIKRIG